MREPTLSETPQAFRKIPNRSGRAERKVVEGEENSRLALAFSPLRGARRKYPKI
jgi:hypothetical protein